MEKEILEVALQKFSSDSSIKRIVNLDAIPALPKGENYLSCILRLKLKVVLGDGRTVTKSLILKQTETKAETGKWMQENNIFSTEAKMYSVFLKEMDYLMQEYEDIDGRMWCNLIHYDNATASLLLEDLKATGHSLVPRQIGHDFAHGILVMKSLGKYHAMSKVLEGRGIVNKDGHKPYALLAEEVFVESFVYGGIQNTCQGILDNWGEEWNDIANKLKIPFEKFFEKLLETGRFSEDEFAVFNHGDCWSNNMMFKYDWENRPICVKFLDFQLPHYNSPCVDLSNYLYWSIQPSIRRKNLHIFIKTYHDSLIKSLDKFGYTGVKPTLADINKSMERLQFFGLSMFVSNYALFVCENAEGLDLDKLLESRGAQGYNPGVLKEAKMKEIIGPDVIDFVSKFF